MLIRWLLILLFSLFCGDVGSAQEELPFDMLIKEGRIVDGTGSPWFVADIGIRAGRIAKIGRIDTAQAKSVIQARNLVVAPGFIDMMGQTASPMVNDPRSAINLLTQGVTTINAGEGVSAAPLSKEEEIRKGYTTMAEYFALVESRGIPINMVQTVGHTQVRRIILGDQDRRPSEDELGRMKALVREAMQAGAIGVSTALIYPPAVYAQTREIAELASVAGEFGGRYYTHMRNEGDQLLEAIDEALEIGRTGKAPVHIFHLKAAGRQNWGKMQLAIAKIKEARSKGEQVTADIYPYVNNGLGIAALIHPRHFSKGRRSLLERLDDPPLRAEIRREMESMPGWENWYRHAGKDWNRIVVGRSNHPQYKKYDGQSVGQMAKATKQDPWDLFFELVKSGAFALPETMSDANKIRAIQEEFVSFCTDVGPASGFSNTSHPRAFGSFPRLLSRYVRDLGVISLERAVAQASAAAANNIGAYDRGRIAVGLAADLIVFDYERLADHADFQNPSNLSTGMKHVIVNGVPVLKDGKQTKALPGRVLRGPGYRESTASYHVMSGNPDPKFAGYDRLMHEFMKEHRVPGAAIAVTHQGKIVYSRGYGYADIAKQETVSPQHLFRIASISKPITAVAILQLVEKKKLKLESPILEVLDLESEIKETSQFDQRWRKITIRHLLEHRAGWDRRVSFDAMFQSIRFATKTGRKPPADQTAVIRAMLSQPLDFPPGERYAYSNFGYCLLGRVVEKLTGMTYEKYVQQKVLRPIGISQMRIGASRLSGRAENEVRYYQPGLGTSVFQRDLNQEVPWPYGGWNLEAMDSHGGWIASAEDLARFAIAFDRRDSSPILNSQSIDLMHRRPPGSAGFEKDGTPKDVFYSLGWSNRTVGEGRVNHWHTGSLSGTATILIRRHDGKNFVALLNSRVSPSASHLGRAIDSLLHRGAAMVEGW